MFTVCYTPESKPAWVQVLPLHLIHQSVNKLEVPTVYIYIYIRHIRPVQGHIPTKYGQTYGTNIPTHFRILEISHWYHNKTAGWWFGTLFHIFGNFIIPIDEVICFRGVAQPPTRWLMTRWLMMVDDGSWWWLLVTNMVYTYTCIYPFGSMATVWEGTNHPPNYSKLCPKHFLRRYLDP